MEPFIINNINNNFVHCNPNPKAKYGLAFSFWYSNINDMIFACKLIRNTWINQEFIELSIASFATPSGEQLKELGQLVNYIIRVEDDRGHQDGTTTHCNAALFPLMNNNSLKIVAHSDADVPFINQTYFFGFAQMLSDSEKLILTTQDTYLYNLDTLKTYIYEGHDINQNTQFGSAFFLDRIKAVNSGYFPLSMEGHFERDRYTHFVRCGFNLEQDAIIVKRAPIDVDLPNNFLYSFDVNLGVIHQTNMLEDPETEDRKIRLLKLMYTDSWDNLELGYKHNVNPKSPRKRGRG